MTLDTASIFAVVALLGFNQLIMRIDTLWRKNAVFFGLCFAMILMGTWVLTGGTPSFNTFPALQWSVGLLMFVHTAQNLSLRSKRLARDAEDAELVARREAVRAGLEAEEPDA